MKLDKIVATNFLSHRDTLLDVATAQRYQIAGENGAGKTSISVDALLWALFGQSRAATTEQLKGPWGEKMIVNVEFTVRGKEYRVTRVRGGSGALTLFNLTDNLDLTEKHIAMTQAKIVELVGTFGMFVNTAIFRQGDALRFALMRPEERRTLFEELLNLEAFAEVETQARRRRLSAEQTIERMSERSRKIGEAEGELGEHRDQLDKVRVALSLAETSLSAAQTALAEAGSDLIGLDDLQKQKQQLADAAFEAEKNLLRAVNEMKTQAATWQRLQEQRERLKAGVCPTCGQSIGAAEIEKQREELRVELAALDTHPLAEKVNEAGTALNEAKQLVETADRQLTAKFQSARDRHNELSRKVPGLERDVNELRSREGSLLGNIETLEKSLADKPIVESTLRSATREARGFQLVGEAFSKRGIPRELMRGFAGELEKAANALLAGLTTMTVRITLDKDGATKSGVTEGTVELWVSDQAGERKVEMLSGGEKMRVMLALRLGIAQVMARRSDRAIRTLILDESLDGLDPAGRDAALTMLQSFSSTAFDRMLFVTHDPAVAGMFPDRLTFGKMADGSSVLL